MKPRTIALLAMSGLFMGGASSVVITPLLQTKSSPEALGVVSEPVVHLAMPVAVPEAATIATGAASAAARPAEATKLADATRALAAAPVPVLAADEAVLEKGAAALAAPAVQASLTSRWQTPAQPLDQGVALATQLTTAWLPEPSPPKPSFAAVEAAPAQGRAERIAAPALELDSADRADFAGALVDLPDSFTSPEEIPEQPSTALQMAALLPEDDWAEALPDAEMGDLRGGAINGVVMEMLGETTVNGQTAEQIDATLTLDSNGDATVDNRGGLANGQAPDLAGVQVRTILGGMDDFNGLAQVFQVPGSHNQIIANLIVNFYILGETALPPNLASLAAGLR